MLIIMNNYMSMTDRAGEAAGYGVTTTETDVNAARQRLADEFARLLADAGRTETVWTGSMADMMEAAYATAAEGVLRDVTGRPLAFSEVAAKACRLLHRHAPRNPYCVRTVAAARKGVRQEPLLSRYRRSMKAAPDGGLLLKMAARMRGAGEE